MSHWAHSLLQVKSIDEEQRIVEGIASTPTPDRVDDIVESLGAEFSLPLPFLMHHDSERPVGHVIMARPEKSGIPVRIQLKKTSEPGRVKDRLDEAWHDIKLGLVAGLSIGFKPIESEPIKGSYGTRYKRWSWLELSGVTIPANADASIQVIKHYDHDRPAASGTGRSPSPGVSGITITPRGGNVIMTIAENIKSLENSRAAKEARVLKIAQTAAEAGRTKDAAEKEEHDTLVREITALDEELKDARDIERIQGKAVAVNGNGTDAAAASRGGSTVRVYTPEPEKGIRFARYVKSIGVAMRYHRDPTVIARQMYPDDHLVQKAVEAGSTLEGNWAAGLVSEDGAIAADFAAFLRPQTIIGRFGTGSIPTLRRVPFRKPLVSQTAGGSGYWVGEGKAKPLTKFGFDRSSLLPLKTANIAVLTMESLRDSSPASDGVVRDALADALREVEDQTFINPDTAEVANESPASITNGIAPIGSSGTDADAIRADIAALFGAFIAANNPPTSGVWIMPSTIALRVSLLRTLNGTDEFPGLTMTGGSLAGLPVITSEYVRSDDYGAIVVLVNASDIYHADDGGINVDASDQASLEMSEAPTHDSITPTPSQLVNMWQTNSVAFRAEHTTNWKRRRDSAVQFLSDVAWAT